MRNSLKIAREIAKKCFRVNEEINGVEYITVFDTKMCAKILEEKILQTTKNKSMQCCVCGKNVAELCGSCHTEIVSSVVN